MMYGVPRGEIDINEDDLVISKAATLEIDDATGASNGTQPPATTPAPTAPSTPGLAEPCAVISSAVKAMPSGSRKVIPAELGAQCLQSVPLDREGNIKLVEDLKLYVQWQSNLAFLKNPPAEYTEAPVDMMGEMESMQRQLSSNGYKNEYDFQMDLNRLFVRAYDNHLTWQPDILASVMQFQRPVGSELVSVSSDGNELPEIYAYQDILLSKGNSSFKPSPVRTINGEGVVEYLEKIAPQAGFHDADTRWNALFPSQSLIASGMTYLGSFRTGTYESPNTTMSFANGTSKSSMNLAVVLKDFEGVNSGESFFKKFCNGPTRAVAAPTTTANATATPTSTASRSSTQKPEPSHTGYPKPVTLNPNLSVGGYFLNDTGYSVSITAISLRCLALTCHRMWQF